MSRDLRVCLLFIHALITLVFILGRKGGQGERYGGMEGREGLNEESPALRAKRETSGEGGGEVASKLMGPG